LTLGDLAMLTVVERAPRPRRLVRLVGWIIIVAIFVGAAELGTALYYFAKDGRFISARERLRSPNEFVNVFIRGCGRYIDTLYPHPFLAHVHTYGKPDCAATINHLGLIGREYPLVHDPNQFTILLAGGSVAAQLGSLGTGPYFLEEALNRCYKPPRGARFVVLNGGDGLWRQPRQAILYLLYGEVFDGIITLDGFNELAIIQGGERLEKPGNFAETNPLVTDEYERVAAAWVASRIVATVEASSFLSRSYLVYALVSSIRSYLESIVSKKATNINRFDLMFALPPEWTFDQKFAFNIEQYRKYIRTIWRMSQGRNARAAFMIQPVPAIGKPLSDEERRNAPDLSYRDLYQRISDNLLPLTQEGIPIYSLLDIYAHETATLYVDVIHLKSDAQGESPGYRIMAEAIAQRLGEGWNLQRTCQSPKN
jgi:hypothetical protein